MYKGKQPYVKGSWTLHRLSLKMVSESGPQGGFHNQPSKLDLRHMVKQTWPEDDSGNLTLHTSEVGNEKTSPDLDLGSMRLNSDMSVALPPLTGLVTSGVLVLGWGGYSTILVRCGEESFYADFTLEPCPNDQV